MEIIFTRPLPVFCISLAAGIIIADLTNSFFAAAGFLILLFVCLYALKEKFKGRSYILAGILLFYSIGALEFLCFDLLNTTRFTGYEGEIVTVRGYVDSEPDIRETKISYIIKVVEIKASGGICNKNGRILLGTIKNEKPVLYEYGSELIFTGRLDLPKGVRNPGGFDYRRYLAQKGVSGTVFATYDNIKPGNTKRVSFLTRVGRAIRMRITNVIDGSLPQQQAGLFILVACYTLKHIITASFKTFIFSIISCKITFFS